MHRTHANHSRRPDEGTPDVPAPYAWVFWGTLAAAATILAYAHWMHIVPLLPFAFFLVCPLMHLLMHGHHGRHSGRHSADGDKDSEKEDGHDAR